MERPKFAASEIVDFLGCNDDPPKEAVEVIRVMYCDALTAVRSAGTGELLKVRGWVYEISHRRGVFVMESRLQKRANPTPDWDELMHEWNNPKKAKA